jgi:putative toxin-antitoxin system antitoxin component (TIGR02293 family)
MSQAAHRSKGTSKQPRRDKARAVEERSTSARGAGAMAAAERSPILDYRPADGVDGYVRKVAAATPMQIVETERVGVRGTLIKDLAKRMQVPASRFFDVIGVPKATAEQKASADAMVTGDGGQSALGVVRLLAIAEAIVANSTAEEAKGFDTPKWLGRWIERAQPSLGGRKPADLLDTPSGIGIVARLLGSIASGAYR